jgi:hypothetical protein
MLDDLKLKLNEACSPGQMLASPNHGEAAGFRAPGIGPRIVGSRILGPRIVPLHVGSRPWNRPARMPNSRRSHTSGERISKLKRFARNHHYTIG